MTRTIVFALALLLGAGGLLEAQDRHAGQRRPDVGPIGVLLELRTELGLTASQVAQLERIDADMDRENQPFVARLSEIRPRIRSLGPRDRHTADQRALYESYMAEARPLMRQIQKNNHAAMKTVGDVLTQPQKDRMGQLLRERAESERSSRNPRLPRR